MAISQAIPAATYQGANTMSDPVPMTLLDLDAAGLDPSLPAPAEFIQFLYDQSRTSYLTLWSAHLAKPDGAVQITRWIGDALAVFHARSLQTQMAPVGDKPVGANVTEVTYSGSTTPDAPICVDVPHVSGTAAVGATLNCTMGNWGNEPTAYAYQWKSDAASVGTDSSYVVTDTDTGKSITCVVTATNAGGSTAAPPSNAVLVPGAAADASARTNTTSTSGAAQRSGDDTKVPSAAPKERATSRNA